MNKKRLYSVLGLVIIGIYACKNEAFNPQGGELPTHYIQFTDTSGFSPRTTAEANGSNFTFLNSTDHAITLKGDDTTILKSVVIGPHLSYFFKPDTVPTTPAQIYIPYHCVETPTATGMIILNP